MTSKERVLTTLASQEADRVPIDYEANAGIEGRLMEQVIVDLAKAYDLPVLLHTCGSSSWAYEEYIDMGVTAVDTLQPENVVAMYEAARKYGNY